MRLRLGDVIAGGFPEGLRTEARELAGLIRRHRHSPSDSFSVVVDGAAVSIPYRIYNDHPGNVAFETLSDDQHTMLHCIYSRHHNGHVRQAHIERVLGVDQTWVVPYVVRLLGEYVIEIVDVIYEALATAPNLATYRRFAAENPEFLRRTAAQATSYWNCYYREHGRRPDEHEIENPNQLNPDYRYRRFQEFVDYPAAGALALIAVPPSESEPQRAVPDT